MRTGKSSHSLRTVLLAVLLTAAAHLHAQTQSYAPALGYFISYGAPWGIYPSKYEACKSYREDVFPNPPTPYHSVPEVTCVRVCEIKAWDYYCGMAPILEGDYCPFGGEVSNGMCVTPFMPSNGGKSCPRVANPINPAVGNKYEIETDYRGDGTQYFELTRAYNRNFVYRSSLGNGWMHNYERSLVPLKDGTVAVSRADGKVFIFTPSTGGYVAQGTDDILRPTSDGWQYFASNDEIDIFNGAGRLVAVISPQGTAHYLSYDQPAMGAIFLTAVGDMFGRTLSFQRSVLGLLNSVTTPGGRVIQYQQLFTRNKKNLEGAAYPDGTLRRYHYENTKYTHALTGITDEKGIRYATWQYDIKGRAISSIHHGNVDGYQLSYGTDSTVVTDPLGTRRTYGFQTINGRVKNTAISQPAGAGCGAASSNIAYDGNGNVATRTDFNGNVTHYSYDLARNLETQRIEAHGRPEARTVSTQWHGYWRLPNRIAEPRKITTYVYNGDFADGTVVTCAPEYAVVPSRLGGTRPIAVQCRKTEQATTDADGSQGFAAAPSGAARTWSYTYNEYGRMLSADGPRTDVADITTYAYYAAADPDSGKRGNLASIADALGQTTQFLAYDGDGRLLRMIDPAGTVTELAYDPRGRIVSRTVGDETTSYSYDAVGQLIGIFMPDGTSIAYSYDGAHRLVAVADGAGNRIEYILDAAGNRIRENVRDAQGALVKTLGRAYDALGRLQTLTGVGHE